MLDILSYISGRRKQTASGWYSFNAVCCHHNGQSQDKRGRGGLIQKPDGGFSYSCFNCGFKTSFTPGHALSFKLRKLLGWLGVDQHDIELLNLESLRQRSLVDRTNTVIKRKIPEFKTLSLDEDLVLLDSKNPEHTHYIKYLSGRGINYQEYPYMVPKFDQNLRRDFITIPFTYDGRIVGHTNRYLASTRSQLKYLSEQQPGYVFGTDLQDPEWPRCIVVEGIFDALSINGLGVLHNEISTEQAELIKSLNREVIVVPDQDKAGLKLIESALDHGFSVSIPNWPTDIKDVNDAVKRCGQITTLLSILENSERSRIKIEMAVKHLKRKIEQAEIVKALAQ